MGSVFGLHDRSRVRIPSHQQYLPPHTQSRYLCNLLELEEIHHTAACSVSFKLVIGKLLGEAQSIQIARQALLDAAGNAQRFYIMSVVMHCAFATSGLPGNSESQQVID